MGRGECSLARRPRGLRKEVVTLKSLSKSTESSAVLNCSQETLALTPADLVKSRGQPSAWRPRCCARSVAYPGASLKSQCGRPSLSRRPAHQSSYRARERWKSREAKGPSGPLTPSAPLRCEFQKNRPPRRSFGPRASPAGVETPEPQSPGQHKRDTPPPAPRPASPHAMEKSR